MVNLKALYSYDGQEPREIPNEITLSDGRSRTDRTTFTKEEIEDAGWVGPYTKPDFDERTQFLRWDSDLVDWKVFDIPNEVSEPKYDNIEDFMRDLRSVRNSKLAVCDWTQLFDVGISTEKIIDWKKYRQELRDFPSVIENDENISDYMNDINLIPFPEEPK